MNEVQEFKFFAQRSEDYRVDLTFAHLGECLAKRKNYTEILTAFVNLKIDKGEEYASRLVLLSSERLQQWRGYFEQGYMLSLWRLLRFYERHPQFAVQHKTSLVVNPFDPSKPFSLDYIMSVFAQLNNVIYRVYEAIVKLSCYYRVFSGVSQMRACVSLALRSGSRLSDAQAKQKSAAIALMKQSQHSAYVQDVNNSQAASSSGNAKILVVIEKMLRCEITLHAMQTPTVKLKACCVVIGQQLTKKLSELEVVELLLIRLNGLLHIDDVSIFQNKLNYVWGCALVTVQSALQGSIDFVDAYLKNLQKQLGTESFFMATLLGIQQQEQQPQAAVYLQICKAIQELYLATKCTNNYLCCEQAVGSPFDSRIFAKHFENFQAVCVFLELDKKIATVLGADKQRDKIVADGAGNGKRIGF